MTPPDDDGTADAEVAKFKRKRQVRLTVSGVLAVVVLVVIFYLFLNTQFLVVTTESQELAQLQRCDLNPKRGHYDPAGQGKSYTPPLTNKCQKVIIKLLRRLAKEHRPPERPGGGRRR